jgi:hypothetical protein
MKIPSQISRICEVIENYLTSSSTHTSSSSSSSESTMRVEFSSSLGVELCIIYFLLYFSLNYICIPLYFMHEIVTPIILLVMPHRFTECAVNIGTCLDIILHIITFSRVMSSSTYLTQGYNNLLQRIRCSSWPSDLHLIHHISSLLSFPLSFFISSTCKDKLVN